MQCNSEETLVATTNDLKNGMVLNLEGQLWQVVEFQHVKPGKGPAFVRTKIKNVLSGKTVDKTFNAGLKVETATVDRRDMQYLYKDGDDYVFHEDSVLFVELPASVVLTISHTEPGLQGDRSSAGTKPATVETGAEIQVPLFLNTGDKVKVDTRSGSYISRVND